MPITYPYIQYGGIWTTSQATDAVAAGTWAVPPTPKLFGWGKNNVYQLGLGNTTYYSSPKQVGASAQWIAIDSGSGEMTFGVTEDGKLWSWGSYTGFSTPTQFGSDTNWAKCSTDGSATSAFGLFLKSTGTLWSWGINNYGQLGVGTTTNNFNASPGQVGALTNWLDVCASGYRGAAYAVKTDGTLWSWGQNEIGQLGQGNLTYYSSPKQVGSLTNWATLARTGSRSYFTAVVKTDGTLWSWGGNGNGQLGQGNTTDISSPKQIGSLTNWKLPACGFVHMAAVKTDGTLWSWGSNTYGQLGLGNVNSYSSPKQVGSLTNWLSVACGMYSIVAVKTDGSIWVWGRNNRGQLGTGNTTNYSSPKQVGSLTSWTAYGSGWDSTYGTAKT